MKTISNALKVIPGMVLAFAIAFIAQFIERLLPIHIIGASVIALFLGMIINNFLKVGFFAAGINPMIHGFIISALVVVVAIFVGWCMGLV